jgi:hypothetical protein
MGRKWSIYEIVEGWEFQGTSGFEEGTGGSTSQADGGFCFGFIRRKRFLIGPM